MTILNSIPLTTIKRIASPLALTINTQTGVWILRRKTRKNENPKFKQFLNYEVSHLYENQIRNKYRFRILIPLHLPRLLPQLTPQWHSLQMQGLLISFASHSTFETDLPPIERFEGRNGKGI